MVGYCWFLSQSWSFIIIQDHCLVQRLKPKNGASRGLQQLYAGFPQCNRVEFSAAQCSVNVRKALSHLKLGFAILCCSAAHIDRCEDTTYGALLPRRCDNHCRCTDFCLSGLYDCRGRLGVLFHEHVASFCTTWPHAVFHRVTVPCTGAMEVPPFPPFWRQSVHDLVIHDFRPAVTDAAISAYTISIMLAVCASSSALVGQLHTL